MGTEYIGNIYMITSIDKKALDFLKKYDVVDDDNLIACKYVLAKEDARLIKIHDNCYIDKEGIKSINDIKLIAELLKSNSTSNIIMKNNIYDPYIGELFVKDIRKIKVKKLNNTQN